MDINLALMQAVDHHRAGRLNDAIAGYRAILAADPDNVAALANLGAARRAGGAYHDAVALLRRAVALIPEFAGAYLNLGNALAETGDLEAASQAFAEAARLDQASSEAHLNWGDALTRMGNDREAITIFEEGLRRAPDDARLLTNIANSQLNLGNVADAVTRLERAAKLSPNDATIRRNHANALRLAGQIGPALAILDEILVQTPGDADAQSLRALAHFASGDFAAAWADYGARWRSAHHEKARPFTQPQWIGEDLSGKTLLVWGEQAVGDELMFATMLREVIEAAGHVVFETEHRLVSLFARAFPSAEIVARRDPPLPRLATADIDFQIAVGDLGSQLRKDASAFHSNRPYLVADPTRAAFFRQRYDDLAGKHPRIGVSWRSGIEHAGNARSLDAQALARLVSSINGWWLSLQYGDVAEDLARLRNASIAVPHIDELVDPLTSLDELAAQMAGLDLVVSIANTNVHLAGALRCRTLALLPAVADWRWGAAGDACLWYPTVTLLRQPHAGDWVKVVEQAAAVAGLRSC
ncbi:MAG: tetratricopeptide repeat protein [Rhodospirillaceae bacterium]